MKSIGLFFKQLFCQHIFKDVSIEETRKARIRFGGSFGVITTYGDYQFYAHHQWCVKCHKARIIEKRKMIKK